MDDKKTCCFTGSRPQNLPFGFDEQHPACVRLKQLLWQEIQALIAEKNVVHFISGMALGVDQWAAEAVLSLKKVYPHITLESAIPCESQAVKWKNAQQARYFEIASHCDKETMLQRQYTPDCMQKRNRYMVDSSQFVLAVWAGRPGGTGSTVRYARQLGRRIVCINPETLQSSEIG
ncbi:MAG: SLOG family protein [Clostridia bacterium]